ncbi:sigma-54-dependent Fis family transcriptional regulator [Denitrobaculum tricleocarpae]|uniref:Sigma-54-dependent Fis family transcriptional regulator n=2 Tax=Denitrobaculum tricleocarpae TaxID=2591009 RepID=A0A545TN57_9PROT|nr:sigma-54-dependent Fis family transcriptional regulator [Denitrobaculum tricleocarpae]
MSRLAASWSRSLTKHGLHPGKRRAPDRVTASDLRSRRESLGEALALASPGLDRLFEIVGKPGCAVLLTDAEGIVMDQRLNDVDEHTFKQWGFWQGTNWSEEAEGTNGVGTCLTEKRRVVIHRDEHFLARNTGISCIDAPIFGPDGNLIGALGVSSARYDQSPALNAMIAALVSQTAQNIEVSKFRAAYPKSRIVMLPGENLEAGALLAVDQDDLVVGASRSARRRYLLGVGGDVEPCLASDLLSDMKSELGFEGAERRAVLQALTQTGNNVSEAARLLRVGRATLYRRMNKLKISTRKN